MAQDKSTFLPPKTSNLTRRILALLCPCTGLDCGSVCCNALQFCRWLLVFCRNVCNRVQNCMASQSLFSPLNASDLINTDGMWYLSEKFSQWWRCQWLLVVMQCGLIGRYQHFEGPYCLHFQDMYFKVYMVLQPKRPTLSFMWIVWGIRITVVYRLLRMNFSFHLCSANK